MKPANQQFSVILQSSVRVKLINSIDNNKWIDLLVMDDRFAILHRCVKKVIKFTYTKELHLPAYTS